ncbi:MAG: 4-(cytidine 5'-diphospho)-2-C-methyl-D-erythritol kinase [Treponema sp.]|jgi:4-diphosphocytidyl-2-C-methyl-D-erythritol kinase|nr:4-(cytidine 5'-diphospho)-2-C-methyl-D-erythritol kinase [Treponema sp.]
MPQLTIEAPAKINLHLRIKNLRPDGFHGLESIFLALAFGDTLSFELLDREGALEIHCRPPEFASTEFLPPEKNIIFKAISLFREKTACNRGLRVTVDKRIPPGGGLGGGSSDAASSLLALNTLCGKPLGEAALFETAASLGSDVPFFLTETGAAWAAGRGEELLPLKSPQNLSIVLVKPGFSSGTAGAFRLLDRYREKEGSRTEKRAGFEPENPENLKAEKRVALTEILSGPPRAWPYKNDFLPVFLEAGGKTAAGDGGEDGPAGQAAAYRRILSSLDEAEADFSSLSGSGSTCFGVFSNREKAEKAEKFLFKSWNFVKLTFPLARRANTVLK